MRAARPARHDDPRVLTVVDGTGRELDRLLAPSLAPIMPLRRSDGFRPGGPVLVLLPLAGAGRGRSRADGIAVDLELAVEAGAADRPTGIVVAWFVDGDVRDELAVSAAVPGGPPGSAGNGATVLTGTAWSDELARHGDVHAAARCHGRRVRTLLDAAGAQTVVEPAPAAVHAVAGTLDPGLVVTACVGLHGPTGNADRTVWAGLPAVAAAVRLRTGVRGR